MNAQEMLDGHDAYTFFKRLGDLVMTVSLWGLWYHALAGVRHLIWDQGIGLDLETAYKLGYAVIGGSFLLTMITIAIV